MAKAKSIVEEPVKEPIEEQVEEQVSDEVVIEEVGEEPIVEEVSSEEAFDVSLLSKHSREALKVEREVFDGALYGYEEKQITKTKANELIKEFLEREVK